MSITVHNLLTLKLKDHDALHLSCIAGKNGCTRALLLPELNRPGLALGGFFDKFAAKRVQLFGQGEYAYLLELEKQGNMEMVERLLSELVPCVLFTHGLSPTKQFITIAEKYNCPVLISSLSTSDFTQRFTRLLSDILAEHITQHAVLVEVFGVGVLMIGESGIGKSEIALELIERGHCLVADDAVDIRCVSGGNILIGRSIQSVVGHNMEIRGLGIIDIQHLFGVGAVRSSKQIQLVIELEAWVQDKEYERLGAVIRHKEILGVQLPYVQIPVRPGRNISIIVEVAAKNARLLRMGYNASQALDEAMSKVMKQNKRKKEYWMQRYDSNQEFEEEI